MGVSFMFGTLHDVEALSNTHFLCRMLNVTSLSSIIAVIAIIVTNTYVAVAAAAAVLF